MSEKLNVIRSATEPGRNSLWISPGGVLKYFGANGWEEIVPETEPIPDSRIKELCVWSTIHQSYSLINTPRYLDEHGLKIMWSILTEVWGDFSTELAEIQDSISTLVSTVNTLAARVETLTAAEEDSSDEA